MVDGFERAMSRPMRPMIGLFGSPLVTCVHPCPPSLSFRKARPAPPPLNPHGVRRRSYDAAISTFGLLGSITTSVKPVFSSMNLVLVQVFPPSVVLYRPRSL